MVKKITRNKPEGKAENYSFKNISYNDAGMLFIILQTQEGEKEQIIGFNENEARRIIKFIKERIQ